jgi:hypothetical protein
VSGTCDLHRCLSLLQLFVQDLLAVPVPPSLTYVVLRIPWRSIVGRSIVGRSIVGCFFTSCARVASPGQVCL